MDMDDVIQLFGVVSLIVGLIVLIAVLFTVPTYFLWNWLCPKLFSLPKITLLQALGLNLLCGILFRNSCSSKK